MRLILLLVCAAAVFALLTLALGRLRLRWPKYLPGGIALLIGLYEWITAGTGEHEGFRDIAKLLNAWILLAGAAGSLVAGLLLDRVFTKRGK